MRSRGNPVLVTDARWLCHGGVQPDPPPGSILCRRQSKVDRFAVSVEKQQEVGVQDPFSARVWLGDGVTVQERHESSRVTVLPVVLIHLGAVRGEPLDVSEGTLAAMGGVAGEEATSAEYGMLLAKRDHGAGEREQMSLVLGEFPVDPGKLVVLAVDVVVAALGSTDLVAVGDHRDTLAEQEGGQEVALLLPAQGVDGL